ncbi:isoleucine--tRNA ligase [Sesbania bispinosa]|nr:isoleucine--tRNA ligase [Sesbania bispinosa]
MRPRGKLAVAKVLSDEDYENTNFKVKGNKESEGAKRENFFIHYPRIDLE